MGSFRRAGGKGAEKNRLVIEPAEAELVRRAFRLCIDRLSLDRESKREIGVTKRRLVTCLRSRLMLGEVAGLEATVAPGQHEAMVDPRTFARRSDALGARRLGMRAARETSRTYTWWLRDLARCALCGAKLSAAYGHTREYFRCYARCTSRYVPVLAAEAAAAVLVVARLVDLRELLQREPAPVEAKAVRERAVAA